MTIALKTVGRYAPSPTGELHLGNLRTALLAWLHTRLQGGEFILRMEDLDLPRVVEGSADQILRDLEWLGLDWDGPVVYQSQRNDLYQSVLQDLHSKGLSYPCFCSRKDIRLASSAPHAKQGAYPGTCRQLTDQEIKSKMIKKPASMRLKVPYAIANDIDDFVIRRSDHLFAYQLAVTVDDLDQGITEVVRGEDLRDSTSKQRYLAALLAPNALPINYLHAPLMLDDDGNRMSKRDGSYSIRMWRHEGGNSEQLLAHLAFSANIIDSPKPINISELVSICKADQLRGELS